MCKILLETPVYTLEAALLANEYGVDRIELCADIGEGGTTPGAGMLSYLKKRIDIPVFVMVRPRGGDFVYTPEEIEVMKHEIRLLKSCGADGFVFGVLDKNGRVNQSACNALLEEAGSLPCTFHRAFDASNGLKESLYKIIECGFSRILTSGGKNSVNQGLEMIKKLLIKAGDKIIIMPGGGTSPLHLRELHSTGYLKEVHASCKTYRESESTFVNPELELSSVIGGGKNKVMTIERAQVGIFRKEIDSLG
jgi:copper homeostasis protein